MSAKRSAAGKKGIEALRAMRRESEQLALFSADSEALRRE
jgi:hypothetical protein